MSENPTSREPVLTHHGGKPGKLAFVSTMSGAPWGGSEELWQQTALRLRRDGNEVGASIYQWPVTPAPVTALLDAGARIHFRSLTRSLAERISEKILRRLAPTPVERAAMEWLQKEAPDLVVISQGGPWDGVPWMTACRMLGLKYCAIVHAHSEMWWPLDEFKEAYREGYTSAERVFFVSHANQKLMEMQLGSRFGNAEVVINPWKVDATDPVPWPNDDGVFNLACVGRVDPRAKGHDLLIQVMALPKWRERPVRLNVFGDGRYRQGMEDLVSLLGPCAVSFVGHRSDVRRIWEENHALILPSRYEGLPLVIVEALLCGRPVITTRVAGNAEYIREGINGFIAEAPTVGLLDDAMERAWASRDRWRTMGLEARALMADALPEDPIKVFAERLLAIVPATRDGAGGKETPPQS